jgi:acyl-[acyl-carrier-protein] desaturase
MLRELRPVVESGLDRHNASAGEWFPHEYVPYECGRNFLDEPWTHGDGALPEAAQVALELNLLTEDNLPYYNLAIWTAFTGEEAWGEWVRQWVAEEGRHAIVLRDYLTVTRGLDPVALERGRMDMVKRGWYPEFAELGPLDGVVFTSIQELATRISHRNTGAVTNDPIAERICSRIATDENLHYVFYRDLATAAFQIDPSGMMLALRRQVLDFAMPGAEMPGFRAKAKAMAVAGIYNLRIHHDQVLAPVLRTHWRITELAGLSDQAEVARDEIVAHMERVDRVASKLGEISAPAPA